VNSGILLVAIQGDERVDRHTLECTQCLYQSKLYDLFCSRRASEIVSGAPLRMGLKSGTHNSSNLIRNKLRRLHCICAL
jgi:hypothetical protein